MGDLLKKKNPWATPIAPPTLNFFICNGLPNLLAWAENWVARTGPGPSLP